MAITPNDVARVKSMGFLRNRGTECFSGRIVPAGSVFTAEELIAVSEIAARFGNGKIAFTTRLTAEIVGIPYDKIDDAIAFAQEHSLRFGGTGAKIRPVAACKGTTCIYGNYDTQALGRELHERYYLGWDKISLPHKFKIAVGGCPNSCMKPSLNDFGIEGHRGPVYDMEKCRGCKVCQIEKRCPVGAAKLTDGKLWIDSEVCKTCGVCGDKCPFEAVAHEEEVRYQIFVGGTWGKSTRVGTPLSRMVTRDEIFPMLEKTMLWFRENAYQKERLGAAIDRLGVDKLERDLWGDDLLKRKEQILAAEIKPRP
ncbi:(4Fe-4S)-binding protein [Agathobaculum sp.]|uniref:(4Fe-4S)-binding protein n=1 Tax=Agathobaculum sp. TaxID=2048138 RepID=UPI002A822259|nr:(4Fe-4S)-binding protein [Agathobaculum sp.]MDY3619136.1 (4Fe-4S)-binding protein [Agathobaculum sp.]